MITGNAAAYENDSGNEEIGEFFIVPDCPDTPMCTDSTNPATNSGWFQGGDNLTATYDVNATAVDGFYDVKLFANSSNPYISSQYTQTQEVRIYAGKINYTSHTENVTFSQDWIDKSVSFGLKQVGIIGNSQTNTGNIEDDNRENITVGSLKPQYNVESKGIIPNEYDPNKAFYIYSKDSNPQTTSGWFEDGDRVNIDTRINATGSYGRYEAFLIANSTNPYIDTQESQHINITITEYQTSTGFAEVDVIDDFTQNFEIANIQTEELDIIDDFTQTFSTNNTGVGGRIVGRDITSNLLLTSFETVDESKTYEKKVIPNSYDSDSAFYIEDGVHNPQTTSGNFVEGDRLDFGNSFINATGQVGHYETYFIANSTNPYVEAQDSNKVNVTITKQKSIGVTNVFIDTVDDFTQNLPLQNVIDEDIDVVDDFVQNFDLSNTATGGRIVGRDPTMNLLFGSWENKQLDKYEKNIIPNNQTEGKAFYIQEGTNMNSSVTGWTYPSDEKLVTYSGKVNATGQDGRYDVMLMSNSSNPYIGKTYSNNVTVTINEFQTTGVDTDILLNQFVDQITPVGNIMSDTVFLGESPVSGLVVDATIGTFIDVEDDQTQPAVFNNSFSKTIDLISDVSQQFGISGTVDRTIDIFTEPVQQTFFFNGADMTIDLDRLFQETFNIVQNEDETASPEINWAKINVTGLGNESAMNTELIVNVTDPEGETDRDFLRYGEWRTDVSSSDPIVKLDIGKTRQYNDTIVVEDIHDNTEKFKLSFDISDKAYEQTTNDVNVTLQVMDKNDTVRNTGENEFNYTVQQYDYGADEILNDNRDAGKVMPGETEYVYGKYNGDFLLENTTSWRQDETVLSTVREQHIARTLRIVNLHGHQWTGVEDPDVNTAPDFGNCDTCERSNPISFTGDFEDKYYYQDTGDIIQNELDSTIADEEIGERDTYFEQYKYIKKENPVDFVDVGVREEIDDDQFKGLGYIQVGDTSESPTTFPSTYRPPMENDCDTESPTMDEVSFDNQTYKACTEDRNGNDKPEFFRMIIPDFTDEENTETIRFGGFMNVSESEKMAPFPGLKTDCEQGATYGDNLVCFRDQWRTEASLDRPVRYVDQDITQLAEAVGMILGLILFLLWVASRSKGSIENTAQNVYERGKQTVVKPWEEN